jgi:hypothetical protein
MQRIVFQIKKGFTSLCISTSLAVKWYRAYQVATGFSFIAYFLVPEYFHTWKKPFLEEKSNFMKILTSLGDFCARHEIRQSAI